MNIKKEDRKELQRFTFNIYIKKIREPSKKMKELGKIHPESHSGVELQRYESKGVDMIDAIKNLHNELGYDGNLPIAEAFNAEAMEWVKERTSESAS